MGSGLKTFLQSSECAIVLCGSFIVFGNVVQCLITFLGLFVNDSSFGITNKVSSWWSHGIRLGLELRRWLEEICKFGSRGFWKSHRRLDGVNANERSVKAAMSLLLVDAFIFLWGPCTSRDSWQLEKWSILMQISWCKDRFILIEDDEELCCFISVVRTFDREILWWDKSRVLKCVWKMEPTVVPGTRWLQWRRSEHFTPRGWRTEMPSSHGGGTIPFVVPLQERPMTAYNLGTSSTNRSLLNLA